MKASINILFNIYLISLVISIITIYIWCLIWSCSKYFDDVYDIIWSKLKDTGFISFCICTVIFILILIFEKCKD